MRSGPPTPDLRLLLLAAACVIAAGVLGGCGEVETETIYRDLPVDLQDTQWTPPIEGDPSLVVGVTEDQLFRELVDGDHAPIIEGFQGGFWVHVALRTTGMGRSGRIDADLLLGDGSTAVGNLSATLKLTYTREGHSERPQVPIALTEAWQLKFEELFDEPGAISLKFTDDEGRAAERTVQVVFVQN